MKILSNMRFGNLITVKDGYRRKYLKAWLCICDCGNLVITANQDLKSGNSKSCGCNKKRPTIHGLSNSGTMKSWENMKQRCLNPNYTKYKDYGGRGIAIDPRWLNFSNFLSDMGERPVGMTLDRILVDGDYTKNNCRWATPKQQQNNRRNTGADRVLLELTEDQLNNLLIYLRG